MQRWLRLTNRQLNDTLDILSGRKICSLCKGRGYQTRNREVAGKIYTLKYGCITCNMDGWEIESERVPF